jgi:hypothetical protein
MDELQSLLDQIERATELSDDELVELDKALRKTFTTIRKDNDRSADAVEALAQIAEAVEGVKYLQDERAIKAAEVEAQIDALEARLSDEPEEEVVAEDDAPEAPAEDEDATPEGDESEADEPAEEEAAPEADTDEEPEAEVEKPREKVAAKIKTPLERLASRRPKQAAPVKTQARMPQITAASDVPGVSAGAVLPDLHAVAEAMFERNRSLGDSTPISGAQRYPVATVRGDFPAERQLQGLSGRGLQEAVDAVVSPEAITASGGLCAPVTPFYELAMISGAERPVRDSLPSFQADRGGIQFNRPPVLADILVNEAGASTAGRAITVHTEADDDAAVTKTVQTVACGTLIEVDVSAIVSHLQFGNFIARSNPERIAAFTELALSQQARTAERRLLFRIGGLSTAVNAAQVLGAAADITHAAAQAYAGYISRHRMSSGTVLRAIMPRWVISLVEADLALRSDGNDRNYEAAEAWLVANLRRVGVEVTFALDGETTAQDFGTQPIGGLLDFPNTMIWYLFHEGAFLHLDAGTLDLGVVRDSTLNAANNFQTFTETFEEVAYVGIGALRITSNVCAQGQLALPVDSDTICNAASYGS